MPDIPFDPAGLAWDKQGGLLPAIVQHADTLQVLMLGYMDRAALAATLDTGRVTFFSRSRGRLWVKGERSGHHLLLEGVEADCDADTLLVQARPLGPTCHLDRRSCFPAAPSDFLAELDAVIDDRHRTRPAGSRSPIAGHYPGNAAATWRANCLRRNSASSFCDVIRLSYPHHEATNDT